METITAGELCISIHQLAGQLTWFPTKSKGKVRRAVLMRFAQSQRINTAWARNQVNHGENEMSLQNNDWRNFVHSDHLNGLKADEDFQLTAPEGEDSDEDSLGEQTTNVIEDPVDLYGGEYEGYGTYEDYEPNPYDGTYSEM